MATETESGTKWVYEFSEGSRDMRDLLGGKGANVAEMTRVLGAERVPAGFTITTEACVAYMEGDGSYPDGLEEQVAAALGQLEEQAEKKLGDPDDPLLVSVRSGARESMPGMLDTVLNLGLNDESVEGLAKQTDNERFAWDSYRRFVQMYANVVKGVEGEKIEKAIKALKDDRGVKDDTELDADALRELVDTFKGLYRDETDEDFPQDPQDQLEGAIRAVFDSWNGERAVSYRRMNRIPDEWGTAVNVQQMVFGNKGDDSGSGVAFSRDEVTGAPEPSGDFLVNAQGEDVVSGVRNTLDIAELKNVMPEAYEELMEILRTLERHYKDMQDTEFTVEEGQLYMLQTRNAKRPAQAAVRFAVDAVNEELLTREEALLTIEAENLDALLHPTFDPQAEYEVLATGVAASPGAAVGEIVFRAADAVQAAQDGRDVILVRPFTEADDVAGFQAAKGVLTSEGGKASHAALVARGMGVPAVTGAGLEIDLEAGEVRVKDTTLKAGDTIAIDGTSGSITTDDVPLVQPDVSEEFDTVLKWADDLRTMEVRANADTPEDAKRSREFGATGIGLCRTEHMFFGEERQEKMVAVILGSTTEERRERLEELLPFQQGDFEGLFEAMEGLPVTIRLLDPPLHEFLPARHDVEAEAERARVEQSDDLEELEKTLERVRSLEEVNPMLGTRGVRLGLLYPEIYEMQVEAMMRAAKAVHERTGHEPHLEIMVPLVAYEGELEVMRRMILEIGEREGLEHPGQYQIGTMIELPRACFIADRIAEHSDFFSFGTNDLTQTGLGFSRDDIEGKILSKYIDRKIFDRSPFETLDQPGVGQMLRMGAWLGRKTQNDLELGICGEHGGDPDSIEFFHHSGIDYVSCSPFRVPVARVAAAQAAIRANAD
ncbi:MAG: pyruvate, orthophosphate dikinase [Solirubrobacteraceae bacterium]|jgi:pyruvate,orthophosphate dikinase|nr:pyruvate, orthophosphate dikinase [Solirubrobacteraceae bacterium]